MRDGCGQRFRATRHVSLRRLAADTPPRPRGLSPPPRPCRTQAETPRHPHPRSPQTLWSTKTVHRSARPAPSPPTTDHSSGQGAPEGASLPTLRRQGVRGLTRTDSSQSNIAVTLRDGSPRSVPEPRFEVPQEAVQYPVGG